MDHEDRGHLNMKRWREGSDKQSSSPSFHETLDNLQSPIPALRNTGIGQAHLGEERGAESLSWRALRMSWSIREYAGIRLSTLTWDGLGIPIPSLRCPQSFLLMQPLAVSKEETVRNGALSSPCPLGTGECRWGGLGSPRSSPVQRN